MSYDNRHTALVRWAKIALPLAALALLSTLFLFSNKVDLTAAIPYAEVDVEALAREPRLTAPEYSGMTEDGAALTVTAETARPDPAGGTGASAERLAAKLETADGLIADLTAKAGRLDPAGGVLRLTEGVTVQTSTGYRMATDQVQIATDRSQLIAPRPVHAEAPFGTIEAGSMQLSAPTPGAPHDLVFNDGVKLVYQPQE